MYRDGELSSMSLFGDVEEKNNKKITDSSIKKERNSLANDILHSDDDCKYDASVKRILANKKILSHILKNTMSEFRDYTVKEVECCIENDIQISSREVFYSKDKKDIGNFYSEKISGKATEDKVPADGNSYFDIIFDVHLPSKDKVKIIINIEAQKKFNVGYSLVTRGIFYGSRMIAAQLNKEFDQRNYDDVKKVYSIWICFDVPKRYANTVTEYQMSKHDIIGYVEDKPSEYDKMRIVMVHLREDEETDNEFLETLNILFSAKYKGNEKVDLLESHGVEMTRELRQEVGTMIDIIGVDTKKILEQGIEKGIEKGREEEIISLILKNLKKGCSSAQIADFLDLDKIVVETVCRLASETAPDYDLEKIYESYWQLTHYDNSIVIKS